MDETEEEIQEVEESLSQRLINQRNNRQREPTRKKLPMELEDEREERRLRQREDERRREKEDYGYRSERQVQKEYYEKEQEFLPTVEVTQIATETQPAFKLPSGKILNLYEYLSWLGNEINIIKKAVA